MKTLPESGKHLLRGLLLALAAWPGAGRASGFAIHEQSAAPLGRGSAVVLRPWAGLDLGAERWSTFNRLAVEFDHPSVNQSPVDRGQHNPLSLRLGAQVALPREALTLRTGFSFDKTSVTSATIAPSGPDAHRLESCLGVVVDLGLMRAQYLESRANRPAAQRRVRSRAESRGPLPLSDQPIGADPENSVRPWARAAAAASRPCQAGG